MRNDYDSQDEGIRSRARAKRRKTNLILNSLIVIVILLIVIVSANIFFGKDEGAADSEAKTGNEKVASSSGKNETKNDSSNDTDKKDQPADDDKDAAEDDAGKDEETEDSDESAEPIVTEGGSDANVKQTIENPAWEPVGTTQTGEHTTVFEKESADWQEMLLAYSYATGIDKNNMTVWWNENNGAPNTARGTVSAKGSDQTFRVAIEWVDGEGWKPVKVEELHQNDRR